MKTKRAALMMLWALAGLWGCPAEAGGQVIGPGKKIYLAFGAIAHGAEVYVNGRLAGRHNMDGWAYAVGDPWKKRFLIDVTGLVQAGTDNTLAVRVVDYGPWGGGIWRPVKLIAEK